MAVYTMQQREMIEAYLKADMSVFKLTGNRTRKAVGADWSTENQMLSTLASKDGS